MAERSLSFVLPLPAGGRATFVTDYGLRGGRLVIDGSEVLAASSHEELQRGVVAALATPDRHVLVRAAGDFDLRIWVDGVEARREDEYQSTTHGKSVLHAFVALVASACGFAASWLYVVRARVSGDPWSMKMALHMAGWHALLILTLFPGALLGNRLGLIVVRVTCLVFFAIHVGIALANLGPDAESGPIAMLNAASGLAFLVTAIARAPRRR